MAAVAVSVEEDQDSQHSSSTVAGRSGGSRRGYSKVESLTNVLSRLTARPVNYYDKTDNLPLKVTLRLAFQTLGVVWGDLGTSPLYVYDSTFANRPLPNKDEVLGALSLIIYAIALVPLIKYIFIVLKANDRGNGGTFALYSLTCRIAGIKVANNQVPEDRELSSYSLLGQKKMRRVDRAERIKDSLRKSNILQRILLTIALLGTCAVIGDGVLTPAISVLSALSGIRTNFPDTVSQDTVTYVSAGVVFLLFCLQRFGTDRVSILFSPFILIWFVSIFMIGAYNIHYHPAVFKAFNPYYIYIFFRDGKKAAWVSLGGVVLAITGTEAMFADLGHFSVGALQIAFSSLVFPALIIAYIGQAAYLIHDPTVLGATFYKAIPNGVFWPMLVVATAAAIIASQAMISATFSIVEQSMALGCFPTCRIVHTSSRYPGQIYIPEINWLLMALTVAITIGFKTTTKIGNAYGVAVVSVMLVTTCSLTLIILMAWQKSILIAAIFFGVYFAVEGVFFSSVLYKVPQGGWVPLVFVGVFFTIMYIWKYGKNERYTYESENKISMDWVLGLGSSLGMVRLPGVGMVYTELAQGVPAIFAHLTFNLPAMHSVLVFVCIKHLPVPYVPDEERLLVCRVGPKQYRMYRVAVRYGYAELNDPDGDFERQVMDSLFNFVRAEAGAGVQSASRASLDHQNNNTAAQFEPVARGHRRSSSLHDPSAPSSIDITSDRNSLEELAIANDTQEMEEELRALEQSRQTGVVHFVGRTEVKAGKNSSLVKKFVINKAYDFLRRNSRSSTLGLNIPPTKLVQIGMLHHV